MSQTGVSLIWCVVQVTLIGLVTGGLYAAVRRVRRAAALPVVSAGLVGVVVLTTLAFSPWPRWSLLSGSERGTAAMTATSGASPETTAAPGSAPDPLPAPGSTGLPIGSSEPDVSFWGIVLDELSRPEASAASSGWSWPAIVTAMFLLAGGLAMLWFAVGTVWVRGYRRRSRPIVDASALEQIDVLRAEMGCSRPVDLRETDELVTAATIGWLRPVILLPRFWRDWTPAQRRAVLAHELAHVGAGDYLVMTLGQFGLVLHFYHPLIHWLLGRLRLEQELAADAAAASVSGGQREYLKAIAELALRQPHRPMAWPARSFLPTRTTFLRRISMLRDSKLHVEKLSPAARALPVCFVMAFCVLIAGLRGPAADNPALADTATDQASNEGKIDLSYVPKDAWAVIAIRPAEIFSRPQFEEVGKLLEQPPSPFRGIGLPMAEVEQVTWAMSIPLGSSAAKGLPPSGIPMLIIRACEPHDFGDLATRMVGGATSREHEGRTYYFRATGTVPIGYYRPDDRTIVAATEEVLKSVISGRSLGVPKFIDADTWNEYRVGHMMAAVDSTALGTVASGPDFERIAPMLSPFAPIWESTSSLMLGIDLDDSLEIRGTATSDDRKETKEVKQTLDAAVVLSRNAVEQGRASLRTRGGEGTELLLSSLDAFSQLLEDLRIEREGNKVRLAAAGDMGGVVITPLARAVQAAQTASKRMQSTNNLKQIGLAMHNFHDTYRHLPPAAARTSKTRQRKDDYPTHSWRVALLPFVGQSALYDQYKFEEPWDSPANLKVLEKMPSVYRSPNASGGSTDTCYFALTGPGAIFSGEEGTSFREITDGTSNTLLIVEAKRAVPWTKPEDIPYDSAKPIPELGGYFEGGFLSVLCDGSVRFIGKDVDEKDLHALISMSGGETVNLLRR